MSATVATLAKPTKETKKYGYFIQATCGSTKIYLNVGPSNDVGFTADKEKMTLFTYNELQVLLGCSAIKRFVAAMNGQVIALLRK